MTQRISRSPSPSAAGTKVCTGCKNRKPIGQFHLLLQGPNKGQPSGRCTLCVKRAKETRQKKSARPNATDQDPEDESDDVDDASLLGDLDGEISMDAFLDLVSENMDEKLSLKARVALSGWVPDTLDAEAKGKAIAVILEEVTGWHWTFHHKRRLKRGSRTVVAFHCAQSRSLEKKKKKRDEEAPTRDTRRMDRFDCNGWLFVYLEDGNHSAVLKLSHDECHLHYVNIELPNKWREFIEAHLEWVPSKIWQHILKEEAGGKPVNETNVPFRQSAVYYYWNLLFRDKYRSSNDPLQSARDFINNNATENSIEVMDVEPEPGTRVLAFMVTDFMDQWADNTQELAMDSTWNTNKQSFELYAAVAEANGVGMPLAYLFLSTGDGAAEHAKQRVLKKFLTILKERGINPEYTLTDKDWSEINAMREVWPKAKHQLCFWHALRAIKKRLATRKTRPMPYDGKEAANEFNFIDPNFIPVGQRADSDPTPPPPPAAVLPRIRIVVNGQPKVLTQGLRIRIRRPVREKSATIPSENFALDETDDVEQASEVGEDDESDDGCYFAEKERSRRDDERGDAGYGSDGMEVEEDVSDKDAADDEDHLLHQVAEVMSEKDRGDGEGGETEDGEDEENESSDRDHPEPPPHTKSKRPSTSKSSKRAPKPKGNKSSDYEFCPLAHRLSILRLFAKHFSQHTLLPERHGTHRSSLDIRRDAVFEMYTHCFNNNLTEVWAYLWNSWCAAERWPLWARSANPISIPRKRTTMVVEALWRNLKRLTLHLYNRPPIDLATYAIVTHSIPPYRVKLATMLGTARQGRAKALTSEQATMKRSWERLLRATIKGTYLTDTSKWTCSCGAQKYHAYLLCKHLVQAIPKPGPNWWPTALRYHVPPFYFISGVTSAPPEDTTKHAWLARMPQSPPTTPQAQSGAQNLRPATPDQSQAQLRATVLVSQIQSSPLQAPGPEEDGLVRENVSSDDGGFMVNDTPTRINRLLSTYDTLKTTLVSQGRTIDKRFLSTLEKKSQQATRLADDIQRHEARRTLPLTNERDRTQPNATDLIGYRYRN